MKPFRMMMTVSFLFLACAAPALASEPSEAQDAGAYVSEVPGKPSGLMLMSSWVVQDPNNNSTVRTVFSSTDDLKVLLGAKTSLTKLWTWSLEVEDESGAVVFSDEYSAWPSTTVGYFGSFRVGPLDPGFYLIKPQIKQGKKKVGMRYWIWVR